MIFNIKQLNHGFVAAILNDYFNIAVRNECFCAHPYVEKMLELTHKIQIYEEFVVPFIQDLQYYKYTKKQIEFKLKQYFGKESLPKINAILENLK